MRKLTLIFLFVTVVWQISNAQQDPQFTQYTYNMSVINPAYTTGDLGILNLGADYRKQWAGATGGPITMSFFAHTPFSNKIEMGITFTSDEIGEDVIKLNENNINADFAYRLNLGDNKNISFGLKAGFTLYDSAFKGRLVDSNDEVFQNNVNQIYPTIGIGAYYSTDQYYVGLSTPNLLKSTQLDDVSTANTLGTEEIHLYLIGGYVFNLNDNLKLKPSFMLRGVKGAPINADVSINALLNERIEAGLSYRYDDAISGILGFRITPTFKVAYAYDRTVSQFSGYNNGSHEIVLLLDLSLLNAKGGYKKSPRFF
ncbi:PorP/SprF family type IX secretion system membrane protein [Seonamhaeicola marinus]|uniref:Type IX secretion system membrane protein PorP/SprF n=1 Tax=Seonamhaeicola marinus TaxID=1912246 RepID=A0A5D0I4C0_9FLAO|nr:type IX secretion system membrane protein PorP/SprF [Seonamhaeicola marinus]TYA78526.1 type IX secretion system membrane protein PorP/SprF [Seonamhaeicola marinus]